jgi:hypothetical protein
MSSPRLIVNDDADDLTLPLAIIRPENKQDKPSPHSIKPVTTDQPGELNIVTERLNGWLSRHKKSAFGMKTMDRKWYEFVDDRCKLFVFQGPDEPVPLESIDIGRSAIVVDPEFSEKPGVFALRSVD